MSCLSKLLICCLISLLCGFVLATSIHKIKESNSTKNIGSFEFEDAKTQIMKSNGCQIIMTKWKNKESIQFFFDCTK